VAAKKKLGEVLMDRQLITQSQLAEALALQRQRGMRLGAALIARGYISEEQLVAALGSTLNLPVVDLNKVEVSEEALRLVGPRAASENDFFPFGLRRERGRVVLTIAMADPLNVRAIDELGFVTDSVIEVVLARPSEIDAAIRRRFGMRMGGENIWRAGTPMRLEEVAQDESEMTIFRPGGTEVKVNTATGGHARADLLPETAAPRSSAPPVVMGAPLPVGFPPPPAYPPPTFPPPFQAPYAPQPEFAPAPFLAPMYVGPPQHMPQPPMPPIAGQPLSPPTLRSSAPGPSGSQDLPATFGALIDAHGGMVSADDFHRLERRFWALMRVLAKKGLLTNEDFMRELSEDR
jgi:hypothetical protein